MTVLRRGPGLLLVALVATTLVAGCGKDDPRGTADADIGNDPQARGAVMVTKCTRTDEGWVATGTITNPDRKDHRFSVVVSYTTSTSSTLGRSRTTMTVPGGQSAEFTSTARFGVDLAAGPMDAVARGNDVRCVLRGVEKL
ncbi:hypothetical protein ACTWPB_14815 [Nocardia sp. IBHARD005]|uniref:hypothetical protein n=1 Tax=Nocardia sp. IBHARD005 TaxID=3457765 RepID=UPI0040592D33